MKEFDDATEFPKPACVYVPLLVEGSEEQQLVEPRDLTLSSYATSAGSAPKLRDQPAIVASKAYDPDNDAEAYYYGKLLLHCPWSNFSAEAGPSWLSEADGPFHKLAFLRLLAAHADNVCEAAASEEGGKDDEIPDPAKCFMRSIVYPKMNLADSAWRELRRLNTTLVMRSAMQTPGAAEDWASHRELLRRLKLAAGRPDVEDYLEGEDSDMEEAAGVAPKSSTAFGAVEGGQEAVAMLFSDGATNTKQQSLVYWLVEQVRKGGLAPARVLLHGPGGCGKSSVIRAVATLLRQEGHGVAIAAPTGCAAFLINGNTLHSCLHLPVEKQFVWCCQRRAASHRPRAPALSNIGNRSVC